MPCRHGAEQHRQHAHGSHQSALPDTPHLPCSLAPYHPSYRNDKHPPQNRKNGDPLHNCKSGHPLLLHNVDNSSTLAKLVHVKELQRNAFPDPSLFHRRAPSTVRQSEPLAPSNRRFRDCSRSRAPASPPSCSSSPSARCKLRFRNLVCENPRTGHPPR